jgi:hypothetical protein
MTMTMLNFDTDLDRAGVVRQVKTVTPSGITETVTAHRPTESRTFLLGSEEEWDWRQVRDYVVAEQEKRQGSFERNTGKEYGIFLAFSGRWGTKAGAIARYAFEVCDGMWRDQPITITRFTKGNDSYFSQIIVERLP